MPTLGEMMDKFASDESAPGAIEDEVHENAVNDDGEEKTASGGENMSLFDIYNSLTQNDLSKEAAAVSGEPEVGEDDVDFASLADAELIDKMASDEAAELAGEQEEPDMMKVAAEYDAAGRIMARGFYDEFQKLAGNMDTEVSDNQMADSPSKAKTEAFGERGLPTVPTNFAGSEAHDGQIETTGPGPKQVYKDALKPRKSVKAGVTGDDPEEAAESTGGGGTGGGFATVQDLAGGKPA